MACHLAAIPTSSRTALAVRASAASGSRGPTNLASVSRTQLFSRLDALQRKAQSATPPGPSAAPPSPERTTDDLFATNFGDYRARLQTWWKDHLQDKAALVQAASRDFSNTEEEETLLITGGDLMADRYPKPRF